MYEGSFEPNCISQSMKKLYVRQLIRFFTSWIMGFMAPWTQLHTFKPIIHQNAKYLASGT